MRRASVRRRSAIAAIAAAVTLTGCSSLADPSATAGGTDPATGSVVDACSDPVDGFAVSVDADGEPLPSSSAAPTGAPDLPDPHTLTGPSTAVVDQTVHPVQSTAEPALPVTVNSCDGQTVVVDDASRILAVDLYGTLAEIVFSLGLGDRVVGRDASTGFPQADQLPVVTPGGHDLNAEAVLALNPTVVLTDASIGPPEVHQQIRDAGIPVIFFDGTRTLDGIPSQVRAVAGALGVPEAGEMLLTRTEAEIADALALAPADGQPLRIAFLYARGGMVQLLAGPGSGADAMIRAVGGVDVGTDIGLDQPFTPITSEALVRAAPDVIIMMTRGLASIGGPAGALKITGVSQTPAGQHERIVDMDDSVLLSFGPRTGRTIAALAEAIYRP